MINTREIALAVLMDVETGNTFSNIAIGKALKKHQFEEKTERAFITRLCEGTIEYQIELDYVINQFSKTKVKKCKPLIRSLLRMGTYQILHMDSVPDSAACNEMVKLAKAHGFSGLSGFVNGVLRNIARNKDNIVWPDETREPVKCLSIRYSMPEWLVKKIMLDYPEQAGAILEGSFQERATSIRVNTTKITREALVKLIQGEEKDHSQEAKDNTITVEPGYYDANALLIKGYDFIRRVPGYRQGYFTVQDESSMCAVRAIGIKKGDMVLDVCAAPGGKTTAAAEFAGETGRVVSMDIAEDKLELISENVERLDLKNVEIQAADATVPKREYVEKADVVIADLPCSGLGILGRKNDIKYRLCEEQLQELVLLQREILSVVCRYVKPGGTLAYSTCTINPEENEKQVAFFLEQHTEYKLETSRLFLQGVERCDGFYYAILKRQACV